MEIGARLRAAREALGLTQAEFYRRAGIAQNAYSQYESGKRLLTLNQAIKLRDAFGLSLDWLFQGDLAAMPHALAAKLAAQQEMSARRP